jgi:hypothetical protein
MTISSAFNHPDEHLLDLIEQLVALANAEVSVRAATCTMPRLGKEKLARKSQAIIRRMMRTAVARSSGRYERLTEADNQIRMFLRGLPASRLASALSNLTIARRETRVMVDEYARSIDVVVPPLSALTSSRNEEQGKAVKEQAKALLDEHGSLEAVDAAAKRGKG